MKRCNCCLERKCPDEFPFCGGGRTRAQCKECYAKLQGIKMRYRAARAKALETQETALVARNARQSYPRRVDVR